jgi:hypothetical protein
MPSVGQIFPYVLPEAGSDRQCMDDRHHDVAVRATSSTNKQAAFQLMSL